MNAQSLEAATAVLRRHEASLMCIPGVVGVGVGSAADHGGPDTPCLVVMATQPLALGAVPAEIEAVPVFVVLVGTPRQALP